MRGSMVFMFLAVALAAVGCGKREKTYYVPGNTVTVKEDIPDSVQSLVAEENEYRLSQGQTMLSPGLSCTVQRISSGQYLSVAAGTPGAGQAAMVMTGSSYAFLNKGGFNQPDAVSGSVNNILPSAIQSLFVNVNYKINCTGFIVVQDDGYAAFSTSSDDGSILTVDGAIVINNDGNHSITTKNGSKLLRRGVKSFTLAYAQTGGGNFALMLNLNGQIAPGSLFYH